MARSINGTAKRPPARGDLIIYYADVEVPDWQAGHVAVVLDSDILLLQKSNEETEVLLQEGQPALHALKLQLLDAQNTIARYKAQQQTVKKV